MVTSARGRKMIEGFEALRLEAYKDAVGVWTIGYGHTGDVKQGDKITEHQADAIMTVDLDRFEKAISVLCPGANQNQFDAMVSLAFNVGINAFSRSQLLAFAKAGKFDDAAAQFMRWTLTAGKVLPGLVKRRAAERKLFQTPVAK
jgi:lysozyme